MRFAFLFFALIASPVFGQITHTETVEHVIRGVSAADLDGDCLVLPDTTAPKVERTTLIVLDGAEGYSILVLAKEPNGKPVRVTESTKGGYRAYTTSEAWVTLFCTDFENQKQQLVDIVINEDVTPEPEPEPKPDPDDNDQDDTGPAPINAQWLIWIEEQSERGNHPEQVAVMTSPAVREAMADRGLAVRIYDDDQADAYRFVGYAGDTRPALIVYQNAENYRVFPAPKSAAELEQIVRGSVIR